MTEAWNGDVVMAGTATCGGTDRLAVAELTPSGAPVGGFGTGGLALLAGPSGGYGVATQPDGKIAVAGQTGNSKSTYRCLVAQLTTAGALDSSFGSKGTVQPAPSSCVVEYNVAALGEGDVLASGAGFTNQVVIEATELLPSGAPNTSFGTGAGTATMDDGSVGSQTMAVLGDGELLFGSTHGTVALMTASGAPDTTFGSDGVSTLSVPGSSNTAVNGVAASSTGGVLYAAGATVIGGRDELMVGALQGVDQPAAVAKAVKAAKKTGKGRRRRHRRHRKPKRH
ncbi:MAG TPA: hypothetical protein VHX88_13945 [Solirubrobacteraceae bacterium]|nr:hypothetical protein [Solirubrobacteraceae bacterium]